MIVVVGAKGMLGRAFEVAAREAERPIRPLDRSALDLEDASSIERAISEDCDVVINCAAWADVDGAEEHEAAATRVNGDGVGRLAARCAAVDATLVHFSTDYVFDGEGTSPYPTDHPRSPLNAYGRSKAAGELAVEASCAAHLLIRTSWLYAPWGNNFVLTMAELTRTRESLKVVNDQRGRPTSSLHLARTTLRLLERGGRGTYHVTDGGECTWWALARHVAGRINASCDVAPCASDEFPRPAKRPGYSVLDLERTEALVGPMGAWTDHVDTALAEAGLVGPDSGSAKT